jgi:succinate dehydrogenase / fumarate reductase iron-sulfur subunit
MSNPLPSAPSARPRPRPTTGTARGRAQVPGALLDDPSGEIAAIAEGAGAAGATPGVAEFVDEHVPGSRLPVSELLFHRAGAASPFGDDLQFPLPAGALNYHR